MRALVAILALGLSASGTGCIQAAVSAGQPTAMERQLLGAYEALDDELVHASSVRGSGGLVGVSAIAIRQEALQARAVQRFNEDDVVELKAAGCLAEMLSARVAPQACAAVDDDAAVGRRRARVVDEENRARATLMQWAAYEIAKRSGRPAPTSEEVEEVRAAYRRLVREAARPGHLVEVRPGVVQPVE